MLKEARSAGKRLRNERGGKAQAALIKQYIELDPQRPTTYDAHTREEGVPVWVLVSSVDAKAGDIQAVAEAYEIAPEAVEAAILYFLLHPDEITARIEGNRHPGVILVG